MNSVFQPKSGAVKNSRNMFAMMLFGLLLLFTIPSIAVGSPGEWADHPALQSFSLSGQELPAVVYLVRTRGSLPSIDGLAVHGSHEGLFVVSGEEALVMGLVEQGCGVFPLVKPGDSDESVPMTPLRTWTPITAADPDIEAMVAQVNWAGISAYIQWLVDFGTRYSFAANHLTVAGALADAFVSYGLTPVMYSYQCDGTTLWNVEATQTGTVYPDSFLVICGHFDSVSENPYVLAPGADDNATGTVAVLSAAEILSQHDFEYSIRYICFSGEEQGLRGSQAYAEWAAANNIGIVGVLNFDMLGYWEPGVEADLEIESNFASQWFAQAIMNAADLYTDAAYELHVDDGAWWGDHASFWSMGFAAVNHEEAWDWGDPDFSPYYHSTEDLLMYIGEDFMVGNVQIAVSALASLAVHDSGSSGAAPEVFETGQSGTLYAQPNPFSEQIEFTVTSLNLQTARVLIYDVLGRQVDALNVNLSGGQGNALWTTASSFSQGGGTGVYFARIEGNSASNTLRLLHIE
jgi:hypothetical protein